MDKSVPTRTFPSKAWNSRQDLMASPLSESTNETCLKIVLTPSSTDLLKPWQPLPGEDSPASSGNLSLFSLTVVSNRANFKTSWKYERSIFHIAESITPNWFQNLQKSSTKTAQSKGAHWFQLTLPSETKKKANRLADGMHECENKLVTLKMLLPLNQESHQATVTFFSLPLLQHGSIHMGQALVFKPCCALTIAQPTSSVGRCGSCIGSCSCFIYTEQICCSLQWEVLRKDKHGIITQK